ncbi:inositol monophosphatase family protein [Ornithinimicrobium sufpigmenti]|uniref:inositol monophosphatase family protein n=1 Tax=Ornithinimicrobium sufpigmenti TaxID=2508882 RepID=UPI0010362075|nr:MULTISPECIES: inositol monophosphatase [unclassified Ornithinimicrobium]
MTDAIDTPAMLTLMQEVAAEVIDPRFRALKEGEIASKAHPRDLVTVADREAEVLLTRALRAAYPDAMVLGEEASAEDPGLLTAFRAASAEHAFTVDPVDGTRNFVAGSPDHAVMVGEVRGGEVVRSWIWQPQHGMAYVAERGAGAWCDGLRLSILDVAPDPAGWRVRTSDPRQVGRSLGPTPPMEQTWISCGIDYPQLARGACDALVYRGTRPWDHVPGSLLLAEVGGAVGDSLGHGYSAAREHRDLVAAASPAVLEVLSTAAREGTG